MQSDRLNWVSSQFALSVNIHVGVCCYFYSFICAFCLFGLSWCFPLLNISLFYSISPSSYFGNYMFCLRFLCLSCIMCCAESLSRVRLFVILWAVARQAALSMGVLQGGILEWVAMLSSGGSSNPGIKPRSPTLKQILYPLSHKGSPRVLKWVAYLFSMGSSLAQESNLGLLHCRWILYQLSYQLSYVICMPNLVNCWYFCLLLKMEGGNLVHFKHYPSI